MKKYFIFIITLFSMLFVNTHSLAANPTEESHQGHYQLSDEAVNYKLSGNVENGTRVIEVKASRYKFEPDPIVVNLGEKVRLIVTSIDVDHGLAISKFKVNLTIPAGKTASVEFVVDKKGAFHAYCSVYCGPGHGHMHATFMVK